MGKNLILDTGHSFRLGGTNCVRLADTFSAITMVIAENSPESRVNHNAFITNYVIRIDI